MLPRHIMTPEQFAMEMKNIIDRTSDPEVRHKALDREMCDLLLALGYEEGVKIFEKTWKWYS